MSNLISFKSYIQEMSNPIMVSDKDVVDLDGAIKSKKQDRKVLADKLMAVYDKYKPKIQSIMSKFEKIVKREISGFQNVKFLSNTKPIESIIDKAIDRKRGLMTINDLVRGAILFTDKQDADKFVKKFMRRNSSLVVEYEEKVRGQDNTYGYYGSHHMSLNIDGIIIELQIMTKKLWSYKTAAHDIYTASRSRPEGPTKFDQSQSKRIFSLGNRPRRVRESFEGWTIVLET